MKKAILLPLLCLVFACQFKEKKAPGNEGDCIKKALAIDDSIGKLRNRECETLPLSKTIRNYTIRMKAIDMKRCPNDFSNAYTSHRKAWDDLIEITHQYPDLRGEMHVLFKQIEGGKDSVLFKKRVATVWSTWADVEKASQLQQ